MDYISESGILLNDFWHELRDEDGAIIVIPESERKHYIVITNNQRGE